MIRRLANLFVVLAGVFCMASACIAQQRGQGDILFDLLRIDEALAIMNEEGAEVSSDIAADFFGDAVPVGWEADIREIYANEPVQGAFREAFSEAIERSELEGIIAFFGSDIGRRIIELELSARRAMMSDDIEKMSEEAMRQAKQAGGARFDQIEEFIAINDLVEFNVQGALNANFAFMRGLQEAQSSRDSLSEGQLLSLVWAQEDEVRQETEDWLLSYLLLAYDPLADDELQAYITLSGQPAGRQVNAAIFHAFDAVLIEQSRMLGRTIAFYLKGSDI